MSTAQQARTVPPLGQRLTVSEFLELPEAEPALELLGGVVRQKVSPKLPHGVLQFSFATRVDAFARQHGLGIVVTETRFVRADWAPVPDFAFYRWERLPLKPDGTVADDLLIPPDLAVEIVSPEQSISELVRKCSGFVESGVAVTVLVHPAERSVFVFRPGAPVRVFQGEDRIEVDDVLPGFELTVAELFGFLTPRRPAPGPRLTE